MPSREQRIRVWKGELKKTSGGLTRDDLVKNRKGKIVSRKKSRQASEFNNLGEWLRDKGDKFQGKTARQEEKENEPEKAQKPAPKPKTPKVKPVPKVKVKKKPAPKKPVAKAAPKVKPRVPKPRPVPKPRVPKPRARPPPRAHPRPKPSAPKTKPQPHTKPHTKQVVVKIADKAVAQTTEAKDNPKHWDLSVSNIRSRRQRKRVDYSKFF